MTPLYNRMVAAMAGEAAPPEPPATPRDFAAYLQEVYCPDVHVLLEWDNDGHSEAKVIEYSQVGGGSGWSQIATPGASDTDYLHEDVSVASEQDMGYWRIRWSGSATWANAEEFVTCPE